MFTFLTLEDFHKNILVQAYFGEKMKMRLLLRLWMFLRGILAGFCAIVSMTSTTSQSILIRQLYDDMKYLWKLVTHFIIFFSLQILRSIIQMSSRRKIILKLTIFTRHNNNSKLIRPNTKTDRYKYTRYFSIGNWFTQNQLVVTTLNTRTVEQLTCVATHRVNESRDEEEGNAMRIIEARRPWN